jgi:hypothetical protein
VHVFSILRAWTVQNSELDNSDRRKEQIVDQQIHLREPKVFHPAITWVCLTFTRFHIIKNSDVLKRYITWSLVNPKEVAGEEINK